LARARSASQGEGLALGRVARHDELADPAVGHVMVLGEAIERPSPGDAQLGLEAPGT
jgi:hypothetical protein